MRTVTDLPCPVREEEDVGIAMADGTRLSARIWRPEGSEGAPVPAILEFVPYRKRFGTAVRDAVTHRDLAGHGYASVRVDLRGSGESGGLLLDEYLPSELRDAQAVIAWIATQPWCDGGVGMMGISWGGFNALQVAARRPPALKAIVTLSSTDDRYADDIHHMGGCLLADNLSWSSVMFAYNSLPPDPALAGEGWREAWLERLEANRPWLVTWLEHQRRDGYWKHGSICEDHAAVNVPVYAISGWADGYSNAVFRLLAALGVPCKGLIGPWSHRYPHFGVPGPAIGFLQELLRWWDHWLKGRDTGIMDEPRLRVWMQDSVPPTSRYVHRPGRWVAERAWPSPSVGEVRFGLAGRRLVPGGARPGTETASIRSPLALGLFAGKWCSYGAAPDLAHDQRQEDGGALVFDGPPLSEPMEILGAPVFDALVEVDRPVAMVAARLSDVRPDDEVTRVTYGLLNLTHRNGSERPQPLEPGRPVRIRLPLNGIAQAFPAGHRLRLALSTSYWPLAWPPPEPVRLTVHLAGSALSLPVRPPRAEDGALRLFGPPEGAPPPARTLLAPEEHAWRVVRDLATDCSTLEVVNDAGAWRLEDIDLCHAARGEERYTSVGDDFGSVRGEARWTRRLWREGWGIRTRTRTVLSSDPATFHVEADQDAWETGATGERRVHCRSWSVAIPRDLA